MHASLFCLPRMSYCLVRSTHSAGRSACRTRHRAPSQLLSIKGIYILYIGCVKRGTHLRAAEIGKPGAAHSRTSTRAQKRTSSTWTPVYRLVRRIPKGRVISYGQLARATKLPGGARAAGYAMAACPQAP